MQLKASTTKDLLEWPDVHSSTPEYGHRFHGEIGSWMLERQRQLLMQALQLSPENQIVNLKKALDVGGGHGQVTPLLLKAGFNVTTVVSDNIATELLFNEIKQSGLTDNKNPSNNNYNDNLKLVVSPLDKIPFDDKSFPVVFSLRLLCHVPDWRNYLRELCRVASHQVIFDYPSQNSVNFFQPYFFKLKLAIEGNTRTFQVFKDSEIITELKKNNFKEIKLFRQFLLPMSLHRLFRSRKISNCIEKYALTLGLTSYLGSPIILSATRTN
jgi:ubiquinone/menaquinone biosynthesis C-methylase UbiE